MNSRQSGFTLIELVMVIVILGVLAASAIPKFTNLSAEAGQAAVDGIAGAFGSASAINYAVRSLKGTGSGTLVNSCDDITAAVEGGLPSGYTITTTALTTPANCTITHTSSSSTANFTGHPIS